MSITLSDLRILHDSLSRKIEELTYDLDALKHVVVMIDRGDFTKLTEKPKRKESKGGETPPLKKRRGRPRKIAAETQPVEKPKRKRKITSDGAFETPEPSTEQMNKAREAVDRTFKAQKNEPESSCCGASIYEGEPHDFGSKYCSECNQPCSWRSNKPLPSSADPQCKHEGCTSFLIIKNGYCRKHLSDSK